MFRRIELNLFEAVSPKEAFRLLVCDSITDSLYVVPSDSDGLSAFSVIVIGGTLPLPAGWFR